MSCSRITWGFDMSTYLFIGKKKKLKRWLPEEGARGLVAIQALYYLKFQIFRKKSKHNLRKMRPLIFYPKN